MNTDKLPPHDLAAEQGVLACILIENESIAQCRALSPEHFFHLPYRKLFETCVAMYKAGIGIDTITLSTRLNGELESVGGLAYLASLPDVVPSAANLTCYLQTVREKFVQRRALQTTAAIERAILGDPEHAASHLRAGRDALEYLTRECADNKLSSRLFNYAVKPPELRQVYTLSSVPICTPGNLTALTAHSKAGKTAFLIAMMAAAATERPETSDTLSLLSRNESGRALIHFDTEHSPEDHWFLMDCALRRAGLPLPPKWLLSYKLTGMSATDAWQAVQRGVAEGANTFGGIHSILIDGVGDLVRDVNDPEECNAFVAQLHDMAIQYDCPIVVVIHFNPGSEKVRGHLGSQLERKCETNLVLEKADDVTVVWSAKQRRAPIPKDRGPRFKWDSAAGMHISCDSASTQRDSAKVERLRMERDDVFNGHKAMRYSDLKSTVKTVLTVSDRTAERKIESWRQCGLIEKGVANLFIPKD